jgi:hypothetical protein
MTGDGCRYCQPQDYIDRLRDNAKDDHDEIERLEARIAELEVALRPFAVAARSYPDGRDNRFYGVLMADLRRAAAALGENIKPELDDADA